MLDLKKITYQPQTSQKKIIDNINFKVHENEIREQVRRINEELDKDQRKIIKMNFFENKSHKIIAEELEIPLGTVKSRIRLALTKMRHLVEVN